VNKGISARLSSLSSMMTTLLEQVQGGDSIATETVVADSSPGTVLGTSSTMPRWGGLAKANDGGRCFYCGLVGHLVADCDEAKLDIQAGLLKVDVKGKLRLYNGDSIPNMSNATTIRERVRRYYGVAESLETLNMRSVEVLDLDDSRVELDLDTSLEELDLDDDHMLQLPNPLLHACMIE